MCLQKLDNVYVNCFSAYRNIKYENMNSIVEFDLKLIYYEISEYYSK